MTQQTMTEWTASERRTDDSGHEYVRTWTEIGRNDYTDGQQKTYGRIFESMDWQTLPCTLGMMPGENIKQAIKDLRIPKVSHVAVSSEAAPYGVYGVRGHYKNGTANIYLIDAGSEVCVLASDLYR